MGIIIHSEDRKCEIWQSSYSTWSTFKRNFIRYLFEEKVNEIIDKKIKEVKSLLKVAKDKYKEISVIIDEFDITKYRNNIFEKEIEKQISGALDDDKSEIAIFYETSSWTPQQCKDIYKLIVTNSSYFASEHCTDYESVRSLLLINGMKYCADNNMSTIES